MPEHSVVIAGAGPTGMMLAAELALAKVDVALVERRPSSELAGSRAGGMHARTLEVLDQRGVAQRFLDEGKPMQVAGFALVPLDISDAPTRHPYGLALWQNHIERILAGWVSELPVKVYRSRDVTGFTQDDSGVTLETSGGPLRARYLVGCDGGRSVVRKAAGIDFPGWEPTISHLLAEAELAQEPKWGVLNDARGMHAISKMDSGKHVRIMVTDAEVVSNSEPTLGDLRAALIGLYGTDYGVHSPISITRFTDAARQATRYRERRVLLAGDSAHIHYPAGGQGLNLGVQDAVNLGWKLAQVVKGTSPENLLDTYQAERHPVAARAMRNTLAQVALRRTDERSKAARESVAELLSMTEPRKRYGAMMSGLDIHYDLGGTHPLAGRRMPDLDVVTGKGTMRVYALLHDARPVLLNLGPPGAFDVTPWASRVKGVDAKFSGAWELPVLGIVAAPEAVLIRPDGHVAWVGDSTASGLRDALTRWFGAA